MIILLLSCVILILAIVLLFLIFRLNKNSRDLLLHQRIDSLKEELNKNFVATHLEASKNLLGEFSRLYEKLGHLDRETTEILNLSKSFVDILKPTKSRGLVGESILENLLTDILPAETVLKQHTFRNGKKVDFAIKLKEGLIPIDAKFSLEAFRNYLEAPAQDKEKQRKLCIESLKTRVEETHQYIQPAEGTLEFSLMYVPSEALYYFLITETELLEYAHRLRVFIVGPNSFYVYLKTLLIGLGALKVEERAKQLYAGLKGLEIEMAKLTQDYTILGSHLRNAGSKYEEVYKKIEGLNLKLTYLNKQEQ